MKDQRELETSSNNPGSLAIYETALRAFNAYRGDPVAIIDQALRNDPDFAMGHVLRGYVHVSLWERSVITEVQTAVDKLRQLSDRCNDRERWHTHALAQWASGDWDGMRTTLDHLLAEYPRDLLALQIGHLADFYHGDHENLRGRIARVLPAWTRDDTGYAFLLGMLAFGLEQCGNISHADETGRQALAFEPQDCWAHHAVTHVLEMQGRQCEGIAFMENRKQYWAQSDNTFQFHNWWHYALFHLDQGHFDRVLELYDAGVRQEHSGVQILLVDAVAMLWRMHLRGLDVGNRWIELADHYENDNEAGFYAFNDMHAMMALTAAGRDRAAGARLVAIQAASKSSGTNAGMTRLVGLPIARAIAAFCCERYAEVIDLLLPVRYRAEVFGGSHAQRDIVHRTLVEAAIRAGNKSLAHSLVNERVFHKPACPFNRELRRRVNSMSISSDYSKRFAA